MFLFRGDGKPMGWRVITNLSESHSELQGGGVGFVVEYEITLLLVSSPGPLGASAAIEAILSLFE